MSEYLECESTLVQRAAGLDQIVDNNHIFALAVAVLDGYYALVAVASLAASHDVVPQAVEHGAKSDYQVSE